MLIQSLNTSDCRPKRYDVYSNWVPLRCDSHFDKRINLRRSSGDVQYESWLSLHCKLKRQFLLAFPVNSVGIRQICIHHMVQNYAWNRLNAAWHNYCCPWKRKNSKTQSFKIKWDKSKKQYICYFKFQFYNYGSEFSSRPNRVKPLQHNYYTS